MKREFAVIVALGLLAATAVASAEVWRPPMAIAHGSSDGSINTSAEYSNGTIGTPIEGLALWYAWINASGSQIIFLAYQSYLYNPPVITFLGQHYYAENGTEVFVGNTLEAMEIYNDTNGNGLPDANYTSGKSEILYHFFVNSSASFAIQPINKTLVNGLPHYQWGIRYQTIDGFLNSGNQSTDAMVMIDFMDFSYDFYIQDNVTYLKTNFGIGKILGITPFNNANVSLDGLSLALLYGTVVITSEPYVTVVNGNPYNSTTAPASVEPTESGEINIEQTTAYKFLFGENYTLFRDSQQEIYKSKSSAVSNQSVSGDLKSIDWVLSLMEDALSSIFPKMSNMQAAVNLDYRLSSFLYRVCYPVWSGHELKHDPTYVAYMGAPIVPELALPLMFITAAAFTSMVGLMAALVDLKKTGKHRASDPPK